MDWESAQGLIGLAVALIGLLLTIVTYIKSYPRRKLWVFVSAAVSLDASAVTVEDVAGRRRLRNPHVVEIELEVVGRGSFKAEDFGEREIAVDFDREIGLLLSAGDSAPRNVRAVSKSLVIGAQTLVRAAPLRLQLLFDGDTKTTGRLSPLDPTEFHTRDAIVRRRKGWRRAATALAVLTLLAAGFATARIIPTAPPCNIGENLPHVICGYTTNVRAEPTDTSKLVTVLPSGAHVDLLCYRDGQTQSGPYQVATQTWYRLRSGGWVSDAFIETGSNKPVTKAC